MSTVRANSITNSSGSGAPDFPNGLTNNGAPIGLTADVQEFTSSGTWTKPANAKLVYVELWGGGGGGGSGRRDVNTATPGGGGGGGGAAGVFKQYRADELTSTVSVTIGSGGAGGAAVTANTTNGNNGSSGGNSTFGSFLQGTGGSLGFGGRADYGNGGSGSSWVQVGASLASNSSQDPMFQGRGGGSYYTYAYNYNTFGGAAGGYNDNQGSFAGGDIFKPGTGAAGGGAGGLFANTTLRDSGLGGIRWGTTLTAPTSTGVGLGVNGAAGANFGDGGAGGGHGRTATAGNGGAGGTAGGGGGGGASANGYNSGAGGAGGNGFCRVTTYS